jgi:MarR family transcriptional regulator, organic hydroperoxide resistance regulator
VNVLDTGFSNADDSPGLALWRVTNAWQARIKSALAPFDLTHVQFVLLASVTWLGEAVNQRTLADHAHTDPMMTSQVVRALEAKGLVQRAQDPADARARLLVPTSDGAALVNRAVVAVEAADRAYFAVLGDAQAAFVEALQCIDREHRR